MELHPKLRAAAQAAAAQSSMASMPLEAVRNGLVVANASTERPRVGAVEDRTIWTPRGRLSIRVYRPASTGRKPVAVYFHGGGFVLGNLETHDGLARQICVRSDIIVVSVDYALAPENKFPAAIDDCLAATSWVASNAADLGGDPQKLGLVGDSAGGNLAAVTAIRARDAGGPSIGAQLLLYPVMDHWTAGHASYVERGSGCGLTSETMRWFWSQYLNDPDEAADPQVSPNRLQNPRGLPPTYVVTAEHDPLRDEGEAFAGLLSGAGVEARHVRCGDLNHGFAKWAGRIDRVDSTLGDACTWLSTAI